MSYSPNLPKELTVPELHDATAMTRTRPYGKLQSGVAESASR